MASASANQPIGFPVKTALALTTAVLVLTGAHFWRDGSRGLDPAIFAKAIQFKLPRRPALVTANMPLNGVQQTQPQNGTANTQTNPPRSEQTTQKSAATQAISSALVDDSAALDTFYAQFWTLEQHRTPQVVTILHYGDSPTTADLITGDIRAILQERFGDAGHGFNLIAKPWAWYGHRDVEISDKGWASSQKDATGVGKMRQSVYGLGGAIFTGAAGAQTTYTLKAAANAPQTAVDVQYLAGPNAGSFTVSANDTTFATVDTGASAATPMARAVPLPASTKTVKIAVTAGTVKLFGVDFRRGDRGVIYDSLGLNGATTTVISRTFDAAAWGPEMQHAKPSLIVINYGTNESQFAGLVQTLDKELRAAIEKTRAAAPGVPILIMSPMDRGEHGGLNDIHTNPAIPQIVAIQQRVAADTHCAFFNTYAAMGGDGTMARWYAAKPRLITADLIHPTPDGAVLVAQLFVDNLYRGYDRWKRARNIGVVTVMSPSEAAAKKKELPQRPRPTQKPPAKPSASNTDLDPNPLRSRTPNRLRHSRCRSIVQPRLSLIDRLRYPDGSSSPGSGDPEPAKYAPSTLLYAKPSCRQLAASRTSAYPQKLRTHMETPGTARRTEDIALDLLKFIASTTNVVKNTGTTTGFAAPSTAKPDDQVTQLLELYSRCRNAVETEL